MTGGEILPAAAAAAKTVGETVLGEDTKTLDVVRRQAESSVEMKRAAEAYAKRVAVKQQFMLRLYQPLGRMAGFGSDYFKSHLYEDLAVKAQAIPDEHLQTPSPTVAVPAMMGLSYSYVEPDLKEMYLNLLTTASDKRMASKAHPAFAEIIKQLTGLEARALSLCMQVDAIESARLTYSEPGPGFTIAFPQAVNWDAFESEQQPDYISVPAYVDNWSRLGLVEVTFTEWTSADSAYDWVTASPAYVTALAAANGRVLHFDKGLVRRTSFGEQFAEAVRPPSGSSGPD